MRKTAQNVFNKTFYEIEYNPELNIIDTFWIGYSSQADLKKACQLGLELTQQVKCPYKLNDNALFTGPWESAVPWLKKEWLPKAVEAGVRYLAHVALPDSFGEQAGEVMQVSLIGQLLQVRIFTSREAGLIWLKSCQQVNGHLQPSFA
ncbi:hypothetical protein [Adhaeribacter pallidiroseus]|uniref:Uncharacterized protein n=1 Tax=Adhaeribacter pallidiroseus TaxID=2072847 RepID=A0A369QPX5_9BACT|nr:hypothetical protein [Adhaeribacter pallidiroseus]RDC66362.1 hypothetical protein AHMF7616_04993 [Adhaeribacter pallidiroseus]